MNRDNSKGFLDIPGGIFIVVGLILLVVGFLSQNRNLLDSTAFSSVSTQNFEANMVQQAPESLYVNTEQMKLRDGPGSSFHEIGRVSYGNTVTAVGSITSSDGGNWVKVKVDNMEGWLNKKYLSNTQPNSYLGELDMFALKNAQYDLNATSTEVARIVKLQNGEYFEPYKDDPVGRGESVTLYKVALGDLNRDNKKDAVVILFLNGGGSGTDVHVAAVLYQNGQPHHVASRYLGDRTEVKSLAIKNGFIHIDVDNPRFASGQAKTVKYQLEGNKLVGPEPFN